MDTISDKEAALLGLLCEKSKHAYEIKLDIENRSMDYWTEISQPSIYKLLNKLEKRELLKSEFKLSQNNISQKVYSVTEMGKKLFREKLKDLISSWQPSIHPIDVSLKNLNILNKKDAVDCLKKYYISLEETIKGYGELEKYLIENRAHLANIQLATRRVFMLKGEKKWLEKFLIEFENEKEG
ncbi:PadR family transcriptional regulator [candidate division KSB1 bacterium]